MSSGFWNRGSRRALSQIGDGGAGGGSGFVYAVDAQSTTGVISNKTYLDSNNSVLQTFTSSSAVVQVRVRSSYPLVSINGQSDFALTLTNGVYEGLITTTLAAGLQTLTVRCKDPDGEVAASDTLQATLTAPAQLLTLEFSGSYPGAQTELKAGDTFTLTGTSDIPITGLQLADSGAGNGALLTFGSTTSFSTTITIPDRGDTVQALALSAQPRDASSGALGAARSTNEGGQGVNGVNLLNLNNLAPSISFGAITYPASQGALKNAESASVAFTSSNLDSVVFDSPTSELSVASPSTVEASKTVTRIAGTLNESTANLRAVATRVANGATTTTQTVVVIQNVAPTITVSLPAARLRSGGNNGTSAQDYNVTLTSNQNLGTAPSLSVDSGGNRGSFQGAGFVGANKSWSRALRVDETVPDEKGTFTFESLSATNLSGLTQAVISSGANYTLGGFVARDLTFAAFATTVSIGTEVVTFSNLQAGTFTATSQAALRQPIGTSPSVTNGYTINATGVNPTTLTWLDTPAANSNSGGTAQILGVEEVV